MDTPDDEDEPRLKYEGLSQFEEVYRRDAVSTIALVDSLLAVGTHNGYLYAYDTQTWNLITSTRLHSASVLSLSIEPTGRYVGSASLDGRVVVVNVHDVKDVQGSDFYRPVHAVSLNPNYIKQRTFFSGGLQSELVFTERTWLGKRDSVIHSGQGTVTAISWHGDFVVWANDAGIRVNHVPSQSRVALFARPSLAPRADLYRARIDWQSSDTVFVGWAQSIWVLQIHGEGEGKYAAETVILLRIDSIVAGILPYNGKLMVLAYTTADAEDGSRPVAENPELVVIDAQSEAEVSADTLEIRGFANLSPNDYHLAQLRDLFLIFSPHDAIQGMERNEYDHISFLSSREQFTAALEAIDRLEEGPKADAELKQVGEKYMEKLVGDGSFQEAGQIAGRILKTDSTAWESWVFRFAEAGELRHIVQHIPIDSAISNVVYEMVLAYFLAHDREQMLATIKTWPSDLYDLRSVIVAIEEWIDPHGESRVLLQSLAELHMLNDDPLSAVHYLFILQDPKAIAIVKHSHLLPFLAEDLLRFFYLEFPESELSKKTVEDIRIATKNCVDMLVQEIQSVPPQLVLDRLAQVPLFQYLYLEAVNASSLPHVVEKFADLQVRLFAEYDRSRLLDFLRTSTAYTLEPALQVCETLRYIPELVFLLGKTGENKKALRLIISELGDVQQAIEFCKTQNDKELWNDLLDYSMDKPTFVLGLLENVGTAIDPITLIRRIPEGLEVVGLKEGLVKILHEYELTSSISEGCARILANEINGKALRLRRGQTVGMFIDPTSQRCSVCDLPIVAAHSTIIAYASKRVAHEDCLLDPEEVPPLPAALVNSVGAKVTHAVLIKDKLKNHVS